MYGSKQSEPGRRNTRSRHVTTRLAVVDESVRHQVAQARLEALENDNEEPDATAADSGDEEFVMSSDDSDAKPGSKRKKKAAKGSVGKRKLRGGAVPERRGPKSFQRLLEEADLARSPGPNYLTAAVGPPTSTAARKFCSVCGNLSTYTCPRCGSRVCCRKCTTVHTETRCLKMMA